MGLRRPPRRRHEKRGRTESPEMTGINGKIGILKSGTSGAEKSQKQEIKSRRTVLKGNKKAIFLRQNKAPAHVAGV
jgi:hypothetical protein